MLSIILADRKIKELDELWCESGEKYQRDCIEGAKDELKALIAAIRIDEMVTAEDAYQRYLDYVYKLNG